MTDHKNSMNTDAPPKNNGWYGFLFPNAQDALYRGGLKLEFKSLDQVQKWVDGSAPDGIQRLRAGLAGVAPVDEQSRKFAELWLSENEQRLSRDQFAQGMAIAAKSAEAAERAATWAKWAAIATAIGSVVTAVAAYISATSTPTPPQVFLIPPGQPEQEIHPVPQPTPAVASQARP